MASVDLYDLIPDLEGALNIPGATSRYANASEDEWAAKLKNAFWTAFNEGVISGFTCNEDALVSPLDASSDQTFGRDLQQIVILYVAINIIQNELLQLKTSIRSKAGPVEYEVQQSAQVLKGLMDSLLSQRDMVIKRLSDLGYVPTYYLDSVRTRDAALRYNLVDWTV